MSVPQLHFTSRYNRSRMGGYIKHARGFSYRDNKFCDTLHNSLLRNLRKKSADFHLRSVRNTRWLTGCQRTKITPSDVAKLQPQSMRIGITVRTACSHCCQSSVVWAGALLCLDLCKSCICLLLQRQDPQYSSFSTPEYLDLVGLAVSIAHFTPTSLSWNVI